MSHYLLILVLCLGAKAAEIEKDTAPLGELSTESTAAVATAYQKAHAEQLKMSIEWYLKAIKIPNFEPLTQAEISQQEYEVHENIQQRIDLLLNRYRKTARVPDDTAPTRSVTFKLDPNLLRFPPRNQIVVGE